MKEKEIQGLVRKIYDILANRSDDGGGDLVRIGLQRGTDAFSNYITPQGTRKVAYIQDQHDLLDSMSLRVSELWLASGEEQLLEVTAEIERLEFQIRKTPTDDSENIIDYNYTLF